MPQSLPQSTPPQRRFRWPKGMPQLVALLLVLLVDSLVAPHFYQVILQDGRLFGSPIDILNRAAPVALLAIGMTLVIATGGIDLSVGAVMAIAGATTAAMTVAACNAEAGVIPYLTINSNSSALRPCLLTPASVPKAILTPRWPNGACATTPRNNFAPRLAPPLALSHWLKYSRRRHATPPPNPRLKDKP